MPTTPNGTPYSQDYVGGALGAAQAVETANDPIRISYPGSLATMGGSRAVPTCLGVSAILLVHGIANDEMMLDDFGPLRDRLMDAGFVVVEYRQSKDPAPGQTYVQGSHANDLAYETQRAAWQEVEARFIVRDWHIVANSWGGIPGTYAALQDLTIAGSGKVQSFVGIRSAQHLDNLYQSGVVTGQLNTMFDVPGGGTWPTQSAPYAPESFTNYGDVPCWGWVLGDADTIAPPPQQWAPAATAASNAGADVTWTVLPGADHGDARFLGDSVAAWVTRRLLQCQADPLDICSETCEPTSAVTAP